MNIKPAVSQVLTQLFHKIIHLWKKEKEKVFGSF